MSIGWVGSSNPVGRANIKNAIAGVVVSAIATDVILSGLTTHMLVWKLNAVRRLPQLTANDLPTSPEIIDRRNNYEN